MAEQPAPETGMKPCQVFISYASGDVARAEALHARLTAAAGFAVWFDKARLASNRPPELLAVCAPRRRETELCGDW
jgi:hypothetical protein